MMSMPGIAKRIAVAALAVCATAPLGGAAADSVGAQPSWDGDAAGIQVFGALRKPGLLSVPVEGISYAEVLRSSGGVDDTAYPFAAIVLRRTGSGAAARVAADCLPAEQRQALAVLAADFPPEVVEQVRSALSTGAWTRVALDLQAATGALDAGPQRRLFAGDMLFMPRHRDSVHVAGNVVRAGEIQYQPGKLAQHYLSATGGRASRRWSHDDWIVLPNGALRPLALSAWNYRAVAVPPGALLLFDADGELARCEPRS